MAEAPQFDPSIGQKHIIERPRLLKLLDETEAKIILLVAPAGYGKTTLARQWLRTRSEPRLWVRGRDALSGVGLAAAISEALPGEGNTVGGRLRQRMRASGPSLDASNAAGLLVDDLGLTAASLPWLSTTSMRSWVPKLNLSSTDFRNAGLRSLQQHANYRRLLQRSGSSIEMSTLSVRLTFAWMPERFVTCWRQPDKRPGRHSSRQLVVGPRWLVSLLRPDRRFHPLRSRSPSTTFLPPRCSPDSLQQYGTSLDASRYHLEPFPGSWDRLTGFLRRTSLRSVYPWPDDLVRATRDGRASPPFRTYLLQTLGDQERLELADGGRSQGVGDQ